MKLFQKRCDIVVYHKSLKQNAALEKSPTRTETTQRNHLFANLCAYVKRESLKIKTKQSHFALKSNLYLLAVKSAYAELAKLKQLCAIAKANARKMLNCVDNRLTALHRNERNL
jgi:hypothetical protein